LTRGLCATFSEALTLYQGERELTTCKTRIAAAAATIFAAAAAFAIALPAGAQEAKPRYTAEDIAKAKPSGTIEVEATQLSLILGGASGRGVLHYQGKQYPFTLKAATAAGAGYAKVNATGNVYFLKRIEDFEGIYSAVTAGAAAVKGAGASQYENKAGVLINVRSKSEGVAISLGLAGVQVLLAK
jgi:hypothetical protein